jgi:hypothetical protein
MNPLHRSLLEAAKLAARHFVRHPSEANAEDLDAAWRRIRTLDRIAELRGSLAPSVHLGSSGSIEKLTGEVSGS